MEEAINWGVEQNWKKIAAYEADIMKTTEWGHEWKFNTLVEHKENLSTSSYFC